MFCSAGPLRSHLLALWSTWTFLSQTVRRHPVLNAAPSASANSYVLLVVYTPREDRSRRIVSINLICKRLFGAVQTAPPSPWFMFLSSSVFFFLLFLPLFCLSIYSPVSSSCPSDHLPDWSHVSNICWGSEWLYWCLAVRSSRSHGGSFRVLLAAGPGPALMIHTQKTHTDKHKEGLQHKHTLSMHVTIKLLLRRLPVSKHEPTAVCIVCIYERPLTHY